MLGVVLGSCLCPVLDEVLGLLQMLIKVNCNKTGQPRVSAMLFFSWCCEYVKECLSSESKVVERVCVCNITREPSEDHEDDHDDDGEADKVGHGLLGCCEVVGVDVGVSG